MELENKSRFWVGVILIAPEVLVLVIYALGLIDWSFINLMSLAIVAVILYNVLAGILIWTGSRTKDKPCKKPKEEKKKERR